MTNRGYTAVGCESKRKHCVHRTSHCPCYTTKKHLLLLPSGIRSRRVYYHSSRCNDIRGIRQHDRSEIEMRQTWNVRNSPAQAEAARTKKSEASKATARQFLDLNPVANHSNFTLFVRERYSCSNVLLLRPRTACGIVAMSYNVSATTKLYYKGPVYKIYSEGKEKTWSNYSYRNKGTSICFSRRIEDGSISGKTELQY